MGSRTRGPLLVDALNSNSSPSNSREKCTSPGFAEGCLYLLHSNPFGRGLSQVHSERDACAAEVLVLEIHKSSGESRPFTCCTNLAIL